MMMGWIEKWLKARGWIKMPQGVSSTMAYAGFTGRTSLGSKSAQLTAYQSHVYKCVTLIYKRSISIPLRLYKESARSIDEVERHPFLDLMWRPNSYMTGRDLRAMLHMHLDLTGVAFWLKVFNRLNRPVELWPLSPGNFSRLVMDSAGQEIEAFEFRSDAGKTITYSPEEIVYFRYPHPVYALEGASPIQAMAYAYDIDLAMRQYQRNFFQNSARPDMVLESDQNISEEDARRLLISWEERHKGVGNAFETAILDNGLKARILSMSAKDAEFAAMSGWTKQDILEAYGVPEGKMGTVTDVNRANALGIDITFNSECIKPRLDLVEDIISLGVVSHFDPALYCEHDECVPRDIEAERLTRESNLRSKLTTINEEREILGMESVPWGDAPWISAMEIQYGEEVPIRGQSAVTSDEKRVTSGGGTPAPTSVMTDSEDGIQRGGTSAPTSVMTDSEAAVPPTPVPPTKSGRADRIRVSHERMVASRARAYRPFLRRFFRAQEKEVLGNLERYYPRVEGAIAGMSVKKLGAWFEIHKDETDRILFDQAEADKRLTDGSQPYIEATIIGAGEEALALVAMNIAFDITSPEAILWIGDKLSLIKDINRTTRDILEKELRAGFEAGESMQSIAARVRKVFDNADEARSLRIAQTEVNAAANFGTLEGYRQSGVVEKKEWLAGGDARPTHQAAAMRYRGDGAILINDMFVVGAGRGPAPGNIGLPEEDINCRCTLLPVIRKR